MHEEEKRIAISGQISNERTFLTWIRSSIGVMAFGFVVIKFPLFVKQICMLLDKENIIHQRGNFAIIGIVLVSAGTIIAILSYFRYKYIEKHLNEGQYEYSSLLLSIFTVFVFLASIFLIAYPIQITE